MRRALVLLVAVAGCNRAPDLALDVYFPADKRLLQAVQRVNMTATRDNVVLASSSTAASSSQISLSGLSHGARTVVALDGLDSSGTVIARGRTCPLDFEASGARAPLYFAPTNFFAPTAGAPVQARSQAIALALDSGAVLVAGGSDAVGAADPSSEMFTPGVATFAAVTGALGTGRRRAEAVAFPSLGVFIFGGLDAGGATVPDAELYSETQRAFLPITNSRLAPGRVDHRMVFVSETVGAFISGGSASDGGAPLDSTLLVLISADGGVRISAATPLYQARRAHAATVAIGVPIVFGGYSAAGAGAAGAPLDSIEAIDLGTTSATAAAAQVIGHLHTARAEATASPLPDGTILVVGGVDASGAPLDSAEVFNPITGSTVVWTMETARHGHTATVLSDGRVLIAGGQDGSGAALQGVELFVPNVGPVTERSLGTARANHAAVSLCDGTVLVVGGGSGAELYSEPAS